MNFINPIEILNLESIDINSIDADAIKRAKKKLFAEIELSDDGYLTYKGYKLTKSDCEKAIDELSKDDRKEYYYQLATTLQPLNNYLVNGDEKFFFHFKREAIYQLPDFINFINPTFAQNFDRSFLKAFKNNDESLFTAILRTQMLINSNNINTAFKTINIELQNRIAEIDKIAQEIENKETDYTDVTVRETVDIVNNNFSINIINLLPSYFQSQINKIASSINHLQLVIWKNYDNTQVPYDLLVCLLQLNIESVHKPTYEENFKIVKERIEQERNAPVLKKWADALLQIKAITKKVDEKTLTAKTAAANAAASVNISELNSLPSFANEIRNQIATSFRGLSVAIWNTYNDIDVAISTIRTAQRIEINYETKAVLEEALNQLFKLKQKIKDDEKHEIHKIIKTLENINSQIHLHGMIYIKADKVKETLNNIFKERLIDYLASYDEIMLKRRLYDELEKILIKLDAFWTNTFLKKIKPIGNNDGELAIRIEKGISGFEFKAKNVLTNVGTGLGKANKEMVNRLPPQLTGLIYLIIGFTILGLIASIFQGC